MSIYKICKEKESELLPLWLSDFFIHHGIDAVGVSRTVDDKFLNPVGFTIKAATEVLYKAVLGEDIQPELIQKQIAELMRIQAVQAISPAQALAPISLFKERIYSTVESALKSAQDFKDYKDICGRIDTLMLMAFDVYVQDKEVLYRVRINELKAAQSQILRFAQSRGYQE